MEFALRRVFLATHPVEFHRQHRSIGDGKRTGIVRMQPTFDTVVGRMVKWVRLTLEEFEQFAMTGIAGRVRDALARTFVNVLPALTTPEMTNIVPTYDSYEFAP